MTDTPKPTLAEEIDALESGERPWRVFWCGVLAIAEHESRWSAERAKLVAELEAENQQLRAERDRFAKDREDVVVALGKHAHPGLSPAGSVVDLARENERLREELAPFLELARDAASEVADGMGRGIKMVERIAARHKEE